MTDVPRSRSTRDRPAKPPLSEEVVVDAALRVCRAEGLEAVTMRRVAAELDTGAASLYVYVKGRDELRHAMLERVAGLIPTEPPDPARWRAQLHTLLWNIVVMFAEHPGLANVALANPPQSLPAMDFAENLFGILLAGGVTRQDAAWACDLLPLLTNAIALENDVRRNRGQTETEHYEAMVEQIRGMFLALPPERFPLLSGAADEMVTGDGEDRFRFAVDVIVDGMVARAARASAD